MRNALRNIFVILSFTAILLVVGFFNFTGTKETVRSISELSLNGDFGVSLPYDIRRFPNTVLSCKNTGKSTKAVYLTVINRDGGAAESFNVKKGATVNKKLKNVFSRLGIKTKEGVLSLEKDEAISCSLRKVEDIIVNEKDVSKGIVYLQDVPALINANLKKTKNNNLIIYNTSLEDGNFKISSYLEDGTLNGEEEVTVKALSSYALKAKNNKPKTYHITTEGISYLAIVREKIAGKFYISKPLSTFQSSVFSPKGGVLIASNITSAPATFHYYVVTKDGEKKYQGTEWVLPYGQRKIDLTALKKIKNAKMAIVQRSYYLPQKCNEMGECYADEMYKDSALVMNYLANKSTNTISESKETLGDDVLYGMKVNKKLPISCMIDNVVKPYCNKDQNTNGIDDAEELFHYFANPLLEDTDEDGFSNAEEINAGTKAFHPFDFPGAPKDDTVDGMYELAKLIENYNDLHAEKLSKQLPLTKEFSDVNDNELFLWYLGGRLRSTNQIEEVINSINYSHPHNLIGAVCKGINICVSGYENVERIIPYLDGCLNVMSRAIGEIVGEGCRHCKVNIKWGNECFDSDLKILIEDIEDGRSYYGVEEGIIHLSSKDIFAPSCISLKKSTPTHVVCHELGHAVFGASDRYADSGFRVPSLYSGGAAQDCMTSYDMYILQIATIRQITGLPISEIIAKTVNCITRDGKLGKIIPEYSSECLEDWTSYDYLKNPRLYCPPEGQNEKDTSFPNTNNPFQPICHCNEILGFDGNKLCCEDPDAKECGGDCCSGDCIDGICKTERQCAETEVFDPSLERCCPKVQAIDITPEGTGSCCNYENLIACGNECCSRSRCLENSEGAKCCPRERSYACHNAIGSEDGCCERGCLSDPSNYSNSMCQCKVGQRAIVKIQFDGYKKYVRCEDCPNDAVGCGDNVCCGDNQICLFDFNSVKYKCNDCPEGTKREQNACICAETENAACGLECCKSNEYCSFDSQNKTFECKACKDGTVACEDQCCERDQICERHLKQGHRVGFCARGSLDPFIGSPSPYTSFTPSRTPSFTPSLPPTQTPTPVPSDTTVFDGVPPVGGKCPEGYGFYSGVTEICCPKCWTIGAGIYTPTGEYKCFKSYDPNIGECLLG